METPGTKETDIATGPAPLPPLLPGPLLSATPPSAGGSARRSRSSGGPSATQPAGARVDGEEPPRPPDADAAALLNDRPGL